MPEKLYLLLPLLSAQLYALSAVALKTASARGFDAIRITFWTNLLVGFSFLIFANWTSPAELLPPSWWPCLLLAALFLLGQLFAVLSIWRGDVSIATPILSTKVVFVAFILALGLGHAIAWNVWLAAFLTLLGIGFLQATDKPIQWRLAGETIAYSLLSALCFSAFDVVVQHWSSLFTFERFVPWGMAACSLMSFLLIPFFPKRPARYGPGMMTFFSLGSILTAAQALILVSAIGIFQDAAGCNVMYGSRGVWSLVFVWIFGAFFANAELSMPPLYVAARLFGSLLILVAIVLVFV